MQLPVNIPHLPDVFLAATGRTFFTCLLRHFQSCFGCQQLLVASIPDDKAPATLAAAFDCGFPADITPQALLEHLAPALALERDQLWVWTATQSAEGPLGTLPPSLGVASVWGCRLLDESSVHIGYLLLFGGAGQDSAQLLTQLRWAGLRASGELQRQQMQGPLQRQAELHQAVLNAIPMPIFFKDTEGRYLGCNGAFEKFLGKSRQQIVGQDVYGVAPNDLADVYRQADLDLLQQGGEQVYEASVATGEGTQRVIFHKAVFYDADGNKAGISGTLVDVTELRAAEDEAQYLTHFDTITGLPNQTLLRDRLEQELLHAQHGGYELAVLCLDLDCFKKINNAYGHDFGDQVLATVAQRMCEALEDEDTVARLGGDSFIVLAQLRSARTSAREIAFQLLEAIRQPIRLDNRSIFLSASVGIALYPHDGNEARVLLSQADAAQARAKQKQQGDLRFFTPAMNTAVTEQLLLEEHLRRAIEERHFFLLYQPQVDAATGQVIGAEALLRWRHPQWGLIEPDRFIPLAEQTQLIRPLGEMVLLQACQQARRWQDAELGNLRVAVNLSPMQFQDQDLVAKVCRVLDQTGIEPCRLGLEITETEVMRDFDHAIHCLTRFREIGLHLAVDDFGTGYSSLSYLKHFPIDLLKIDRTFVSGLPDCRDDAAIVTAIVAMGFGLGLHVMAEGVETADQERFLVDLGCAAFQGYYYGRPLSAEAFTRLLCTPWVAHG